MARASVAIPRALDLTGKCALVFAEHEGLGRSLTEALVRAGARVALTLPGLGPEAREIAEKAAAGPGAIVPLEVDQVDRESLEGLVDRAERELGSLDALVVQPALPTTRRLPELHEAEWQEAVLAPLSALFHLVQAASRTMIEQGYGGRIVVVFPPAAPEGSDRTGATRILRASVEALLEAFSVDLARSDITVNGVAPGLLAGPERELPPSELKGVPKGRPGVPGDVTPLVVFLASEEADYLTGSVIGVDGARRLA